jgi:hypothetical protein
MHEEDFPDADYAEPTLPEPSAHGRHTGAPIDALLDDDPDVWLAVADMRAWVEAHPCECEALCECDQAA